MDCEFTNMLHYLLVELATNKTIEIYKWIYKYIDVIQCWVLFIMVLALLDMYSFYKQYDEKTQNFINTQVEWNQFIETKNKKTREFIRNAVDDIYVDMDLLHTGITTSLAKIDIHNENMRETIENVFTEVENLHRKIDGLRLLYSVGSMYQYVIIGFQNGRKYPCIPIFIPRNIEVFDKSVVEKYRLSSRYSEEGVYLLLDQFAELKNVKSIQYEDVCECIFVRDICSHNTRHELKENMILDNYCKYIDKRSSTYFRNIMADSALFERKKIIQLHDTLEKYGIKLVFTPELNEFFYNDIYL
jgi:hypothetical protein